MINLKYYRFLLRLNLKPRHVTINRQKIYFQDFSECIALLEEIMEKRIYDVAILDPKTIIDVGSNIGIFALFCADRFPKAKIICYEPSSTSFSYLEKNIRVNRVQAICHNYGLGLPERSAILYASKLGATTATIFASAVNDFQSELVEILALSNSINYDVQLLKIDVEGSEYEIIDDLIINQKLKWIEHIIIEYHQVSLNSQKIDIQINQVVKEGYIASKDSIEKNSDNVMVFFRRIV